MQKLIVLGSIFGSLFKGFGALRVTIGNLLGLPQVLLGGLWTPKSPKNKLSFRAFANAPFWVFECLNGALGLILAPSWADLGLKLPPKLPQQCSKICPKTCPKDDPKNNQKLARTTPRTRPRSMPRSRPEVCPGAGNKYVQE